MGILQQFVRANRSLSLSLTPKHFDESNVFHMFAKLGSQILALPSTQTVLDAGAGAAWFFARDLKQAHHIKLIGVDIEASEMELNELLDERIVANVCEDIPVKPESVDAITAFSGVEHFPDNATFLRNAHRALRPGGRLIAQFPSRYAIFAVMNRLLPRRIARGMLHACIPDSDGHLGFTAHYDRTNYSAFCKMAKEEGFEVEYYLPGYFDYYFTFFAPLYVLWNFISVLRFGLGLKNFASYNLFILRKPGPSESLYLQPIQERKAHQTPLQYAELDAAPAFSLPHEPAAKRSCAS